MKNEPNINLIKEGKDAWNKYKKDHPNFKADLSFADLSSIDLSGYNLSEVNLKSANLTKCVFKETNLFCANCSDSILIEAEFYTCNLNLINLSQADLSKVTLYNSNPRHANLSYANLNSAKIEKTDFSYANLSNINLFEANLSDVNFTSVNCQEANLAKSKLSKIIFFQSDFSGANLVKAYLPFANLSYANFSNANLSEAFLSSANFYRTNLENADLTKALLQKTVLVETKLEGVILTNCFIYGLSAWALDGKPKDQSSLLITPKNRDGAVTVDDLQVGQFIYLLLNNERVRNVIDTITSKTVLILGRFTSERKEILDIIRKELNKYNYVPILFDFENSEHQSLLETVMTLAGMARFIIADISVATMVREELRSIVEKYPSKPIQPILLSTEKKYVTLPEMEKNFKNILPTFTYRNMQEVTNGLRIGIIQPAENWLQLKKNRISAENKIFLENEELKKQIESLQKKIKDASIQ